MMRSGFLRILYFCILGMALGLFFLSRTVYAGTFVDNFNDGDFAGWQLHRLGDPNAKWQIENGVLICTSQNFCADGVFVDSTLMSIDNEWKDYTFECQLKIEQTFAIGCYNSTIGVGVYADDTGGDNGIYFYAVHRDGGWKSHKAYVAVQGNQVSKVPIKVIPIEEGRWYKVRVIIDGDHHQMFIDDEQIHDIKVEKPEKGGIAVIAANCEAHFDNVVVTGDGIPNMGNIGNSAEANAKHTVTWGQIKSE